MSSLSQTNSLVTICLFVRIRFGCRRHSFICFSIRRQHSSQHSPTFLFESKTRKRWKQSTRKYGVFTCIGTSGFQKTQSCTRYLLKVLKQDNLFCVYVLPPWYIPLCSPTTGASFISKDFIRQFVGDKPAPRA